MESRYRPRTIVRAHGREWIVLPQRESGVLRLRPLTTAQGEEVGLFLPLEGGRVWLARFADPEPTAGGDATGIMTLFDAARLSLRSGAGPFRSLGRISVVPRPYQFVPLIMSLRHSPVLLLARGLPRPDISVYQHYPNLVASIDFVKSSSQRDQFLAAAPDLVIVDEAHAAARPRGTASRAEHQRYE